MFEISMLEFEKLQSFLQTIVIIEINLNCEIAKFHPKQENFKLGTKNTLFEFFLTGI